MIKGSRRCYKYLVHKRGKDEGYQISVMETVNNKVISYARARTLQDFSSLIDRLSLSLSECVFIPSCDSEKEEKELRERFMKK